MASSNVVAQGVFGPGVLYFKSVSTANSTPYNIGSINELGVDIKADVKDLWGQKQFPLLVATGTKSVDISIKAAKTSGSAINTFLLGGSFTLGTEYDITTTNSTAIPGTPYQITPTVPSSGTFSSDLGVINATTGQPLKLVASAPATGQYSVSSGVYTFASADTGTSVKISFSYSFTTGSVGQSLIIPNNDIGTTEVVALYYKSTLYGATYYLELFNCVMTGVKTAHKVSDFMMPEYTGKAFANASDQIGRISLAAVG